MKLIVEKEEGLFGGEAILWWLLGVGITFVALWFVVQLNYGVASMAWKGFLYLMRPENLFPDLLNLPNYEANNPHGISGMMSGAVYLNGIILKDIVNGLVVLMFYLVGIVYLFSDLFEQYLGRMKSMIPRIIIALILAYGSLYVLQFLMILGRYSYMVLYNIHTGTLGAWNDPNFFTRIGGNFTPPTIKWWVLDLSWVEKQFMKYIWSFLSVSFAIMLLMTVAVRYVALAVLIVILPIASILLMTPWTQQIGTRLWWLAIDLIFLPFVMIIPLMLIGPVAGQISFVIAGLVVAMGSIYLISKEPLMLRGIGFESAGGHLSRGVTMGLGMGNAIGGMGMTGASMAGMEGVPGGGLKGGLTDIKGGGGGPGGGAGMGKVAMHGALSGAMAAHRATGGHLGSGIVLAGTFALSQGLSGLKKQQQNKGKEGGK